jgi:enamine deaminase RidA (YjgF/YER057c/UK114 family)
VSGTVAIGPDGNIVGEGDMSAQARFIFDRIAALLADAGASLADVIKITTFITDMSAYREFAAVRAEVFEGLPRVASSTVGVAALVDPRLLIEIEALAVVPVES